MPHSGVSFSAATYSVISSSVAAYLVIALSSVVCLVVVFMAVASLTARRQGGDVGRCPVPISEEPCCAVQAIACDQQRQRSHRPQHPPCMMCCYFTILLFYYYVIHISIVIHHDMITSQGMPLVLTMVELLCPLVASVVSCHQTGGKRHTSCPKMSITRP